MSIRFLIDENVPRSVARFLEDRGHEVLLVRDQLTPGVEDPIIVAYAHQIGAIVITLNRKHFKPLISRQPNPLTAEFVRAGLLALHCRAASAVPLLKHSIDFVEFEHRRRQGSDDARVIVEISHNGVMIY